MVVGGVIGAIMPTASLSTSGGNGTSRNGTKLVAAGSVIRDLIGQLILYRWQMIRALMQLFQRQQRLMPFLQRRMIGQLIRQ